MKDAAVAAFRRAWHTTRAIPGAIRAEQTRERQARVDRHQLWLELQLDDPAGSLDQHLITGVVLLALGVVIGGAAVLTAMV